MGFFSRKKKEAVPEENYPEDSQISFPNQEPKESFPDFNPAVSGTSSRDIELVISKLELIERKIDDIERKIEFIEKVARDNQ